MTGAANLVLAAAGAPPGESSFLVPLQGHDLLLFWVQLVVLLGTARLLGGLMKRHGQPAVIGELLAGVVLGPSLLGRLAPGFATWLFPGEAVGSALLLAVAWLGIFMLLIVTGFETDLGLLRRLGRPAINVSIGSLLLPLGLGLGMGWLMPSMFFGERGGRVGFALFLGVALSISALPVVAKILSDMGLMRRNFGQITIAAGMANDLIGWILLGAVVGVVTQGSFDAMGLAITLAAVIGFIALAMTVGQKMADVVLRRARGQADSFTGAMTATILIALTFGAITQAIGVEAVLGALIAGIVVSRSKYQRADVGHTFESLSNAVFAPIFFATAGLYVDFAVIFEGSNWLWALAVIGVAAVGKLGGAYGGARLSGLSRMEGLAIGIGLNARGALEIVVATIGFTLGMLSDSSYAIIVVMAMVTSMAAPPLLRPVLRRLSADPEEEARLQREELLASSVIASANNVLLPTRGGDNSVVAARLLDLALQPESRVTVLTVSPPEGLRSLGDDVGDEVLASMRTHRVERRRHAHTDLAADVLAEARLGYDLMAVGLNDDFAGSHQLSEPLRRLIAGTPIPLLLVRRGRNTDITALDAAQIRRILVPVTGTRMGRAAEEVAYVLGARLDAGVDAVHVVAGARAPTSGPSPADVQLKRSQELADRFGGGVQLLTRVGPTPHEELVRAAEELGTDLMVIGAVARTSDGDQAFLGYGAEYVLEHASATVIAVIFPGDGI